ncbi:hypothetical protein WG66_003069 [Moniliophthora roreri]|nr:hypothetical protein WG66_003069 [Moniliophthora roreri]
MSDASSEGSSCITSFPASSKGTITSAGRVRIARACGNCRTRKIKCDGKLPQCTPCTRTTTRVLEGPCDYEDNRTRVQLLERDVSRLEARLKELKDPSLVGTVKLSKPYVGSINTSDATLKACAIVNGPAHLLEVFDPKMNKDPPAELSRFLIDAFLPHAPDFGFFLNIERFRSAALLPESSSRALKPTRGLLSAVHVLGLRLSGTGPTTPQEEARIAAYLTRAINDATKMMVTETANPFVVVENIQAELLLATFLFCHGRLLEGQYHLTQAISLAIGAKLHKIRSSHEDSATGMNSPLLPPTSDPMVEGERINAFWTVFILSNCWDATVDTSTSLIAVFGDGNLEVDLPWPLTMPEYQQEGFPPDLRGTWTVQKFLTQIVPDVSSSNEFSELAMYAKASILFKRARKIEWHLQRGQEIPDTPPNRVLCDLIESFVASLPPLKGTVIRFAPSELGFPYNTVSGEFSTIGMQLVTLTLAHASIIHVYSVTVETNAASMKKSFDAAKACVEALRNPEVRMYFKRSSRINPCFGCLWENVCQVFVKWIRTARSRVDAEDVRMMFGISEDEVIELLEVIMGVMHSYAWRSPILKQVLEKVRKAYQEIPPSKVYTLS